jgi:hypothetical protein
MAVYCGECGVRLASRARLAGHFRRAHGGGRRVRPSGALVPLRPGTASDGDTEVPSARAEIVPARGLSAPSGRALVPGVEREAPPSWWALEMPEEWRRSAWAHSPAEIRNQILAERAGRPAPNRPATAAARLRSPDPLDAVILWSQYYALKALAVRLDGGIGTEAERAAFEAGLREYDANFDRLRAQRKTLSD